MQKITLEKFSPELQKSILSIAETIKPLVEDIHERQPTGKNYYSDYMNILGMLGSNEGKIKLVAISMLYLGCNPIGVQDAVKNIV